MRKRKKKKEKSLTLVLSSSSWIVFWFFSFSHTHTHWIIWHFPGHLLQDSTSSSRFSFSLRWIYFWLCPSPVCSCSLQHCFVYIADEPQHLNCDASVKDWVEHVKINNNTPSPPSLLLFNKPAFLWGPSLWGPRVRTTWVSLQRGLLSLLSSPSLSRSLNTHTLLGMCLAKSLFGTASSCLSFSPLSFFCSPEMALLC